MRVSSHTLDVPDFGKSVGTREGGVLAPAFTYPRGFLPHTHIL